jgi:hypothetical protein
MAGFTLSPPPPITPRSDLPDEHALRVLSDFDGLEELRNRLEPGGIHLADGCLATLLEERSARSAPAIPFRRQTRYDGELETFLVKP